MKLVSPAAERNMKYIIQEMAPYLPHGARVLEIASGSGQHASYACQQRPDIVWQATDSDPASVASIASYRTELELFSLLEPVTFNILEDTPAAIAAPYDLIVNINMIHIAPWKACLSLLNWASELLKQQGVLYLYGPFLVKDVRTADSNIAFDQSLKERNVEWGIRELDRVVMEAKKRGLLHLKTVAMPANNLSVFFQKA